MGEILYWESHFPLPVIDLLKNLMRGRSTDPNTPVPLSDATVREWYSQPRVSIDDTTEVITCRFKIPLSVSEVGFEALRVPSHFEIWYQDRNNNWRQVLDRLRIPVTLDVATSSSSSWYKFNQVVYPIVAKAVQFRIRRRPDQNYADQPFSVGMRNALIKRNVYNRSQGTQYFEDEQDPYGNIISKYIRDWDATKAIDSDTTTFWRSAPQPDPNAVVSMYLDCRGEDGTPRLIDKLYLDPVYSGQMLNLYYSSDDTVGIRKPSPITVPPLEDQNTSWRVQRGRQDDSTGIQESYYQFQGSFSPLIREPMWWGIEWTPSFDPLDGPAQNPVLLQSIVEDTSLSWHPALVSDVGAGEFQLEFSNGTTTRTYTAPLNALFTPGVPLRIVVGWKYNPDTVFVSVKTRDGNEIASLEVEVANLPELVSLDKVLEMRNFKGLLTATLIKLEEYDDNYTNFQKNPTTYTSPDPVIPDTEGNIPSTTLDNAIYAAAWTEQEHGTGGTHESSFTDKEWTPIWRNYTTERGMLYFPRPISMKYLKLEFTNLNEEPYPIYDSGIEVKYKSFPISVQQESTQGPRLYTGGGFLGLGNFLSLNNVRSVNWLNPASVLAATQSVFGRTVDPVIVDIGQGYVTGTLPNMMDSPIDERYRIEIGSDYVYRRAQLDPYILAENEVESIIKAEGLMKIAPYTTIPWKEIEASNPGAIQKKSSPGALPIRGSDWWIFPGQTLRIQASVMEKLTDTSTVIERKLTLEKRVRFTTTAVHRYDIRTVTRDTAVAYFAGVREVFPLTSTYIVGEDKESYDFPILDSSQWVYNNIKQLDSGPLTTQSLFYDIENPLFLKDITNWVQVRGQWTHNPGYGHWGRGSIQVEANGEENDVYSTPFDVQEGQKVAISTWVKWQDLVTLNNNAIARLGLVTYLNEETVAYPILDQITVTDWEAVVASTNWERHIDGWVKLEGSYTVPAGVNRARVRLNVPTASQLGQFQFDWVASWPDYDTTSTIFKNFQTTSKFNRIRVDFRDSGLVRSNAMWADDDPLDGLGNDLAFYVETIPGPNDLEGGFWSDTFKAWGGSNVEWGTPYAVISITVDSEKSYQGKRVLHFRRAAGAGSAGIKSRQWTNMFGGSLARLCVVLMKPYSNNNLVTLRLRRLSDGVFVHEETFTAPTGRWFEYQSNFFTIPDDPGPDPLAPGEDPPPYDPHMYEISATLTGDAEDELFLNDLYTEVSHIRYFARLGGSGEPLIEITDLRYRDTAHVTSTLPVNEASIQATILSPKAYCFGATVTPLYLN